MKKHIDQYFSDMLQKIMQALDTLDRVITNGLIIAALCLTLIGSFYFLLWFIRQLGRAWRGD